MSKSNTDKILEIADQAGILRPRDLERYKIPRQYLYRLTNRGLLQRVGRGLYSLPDISPTEHRSLVEASKRVPNAVVCLLSALSFHDLTTQAPSEVWLAIDVKARRPKVDWPPLRFARFSEASRNAGIEEHSIEGVSVRVYNPAKTVADCFKYRNKIGLDVAIEALRDCRRQRKCTNDELWHHAKICRVANVMKPYLEAIS